MPNAFDAVSQANAQSAARASASNPWSGVLRFQLPADGDEAVVRFVDSGAAVKAAWVHGIEVPNRQWPQNINCCDQEEEGKPCPGCEQQLPRSFRGFVRLIWRNAPIYKRDSNNRMQRDNFNRPLVIGSADQIALWSSGPRLFTSLGEVNKDYAGLDSREFRIRRKGAKMPEYIIIPAVIDGGPQAMSPDDEKLVAETTLDLSNFVKPLTYEEFGQQVAAMRGTTSLGGAPATQGNGPQAQPSATSRPENVFMQQRAEAQPSAFKRS